MNEEKQWVLECQNKNKKISYSQGGQDGILEYIFQHIVPVNNPPYYVEFGYIRKEGSNTGNLQKKGWTGLIMDGNIQENKEMNSHKEFITSENICSLFEKYSVPIEPDYVSIDIDSCDLWVFLELTKKYRPQVVSVEYNCHYSLEDAITFPNNPEQKWTGDCVYGASIKALYLAGKENGYKMIAYTKPLDVFFIREDLIKNQTIPSLSAFQGARYIKNKVSKGNHHKNIIDFEVYLKTKDFELARESAKKVWNLLTNGCNK
jgi:hypothetical protein